MKKNKNIIEREYRFLIDREKLKVEPTKRLSGFNLSKRTTLKFRDYLFEREQSSLKDENIGFRVREFEDGKIEFTYKKFLDREDGMARYDEFTTAITKNDADRLVANDFEIKNLPILKDLISKGNLYYYLTIDNLRKVFIYIDGDSEIELVLENITYSNNDKSVKDASMEIEIKTDQTLLERVTPFIDQIREKYECVDQNEGKNTRALKLLGISLK